MADLIKTYVDRSRETVVWRSKDQFDGQDVLHVELAGITLPDKNYAMRRTRRMERVFEKMYVIEYVVSGVGYIESEGVNARVESGDVYIIHRRTVHTYYADKQQPFSKKWINVSGRFIIAMEDVFFSDGPFTVVSVGNDAERIIDGIHELLSGIERITPQINTDIMKRLLELFTLMDNKRRNDRGMRPLFEQICSYIDENICNSMSVAGIAESFFLSTSTLYRLFNSQVGMSPKEYIVSRKVETAKRLIGAGDSTFNSIAADLGFYDSHHFFRTFRSVTGMSPSEYRRYVHENEEK